MARGIQKADAAYEIDTFSNAARTTRAVRARCLISMDKFNFGDEVDKVNPSTSSTPLLSFHTSLRKNIREIGIHPRHLILERIYAANFSSCYGTVPKRIVQVPILTLAQFNALNVYDKQLGGTQAGTTFKINHSVNGSQISEYKIIKKVDQVLI